MCMLSMTIPVQRQQLFPFFSQQALDGKGHYPHIGELHKYNNVTLLGEIPAGSFTHLLNNTLLSQRKAPTLTPPSPRGDERTKGTTFAQRSPPLNLGEPAERN